LFDKNEKWVWEPASKSIFSHASLSTLSTFWKEARNQRENGVSLHFFLVWLRGWLAELSLAGRVFFLRRNNFKGENERFSNGIFEKVSSSKFSISTFSFE